MARRRKEHRDGERCHHGHVEQNRRGGGRGEAGERVENAAVERHQRHEQQIRKRDPCQLDRQRETARILGKARREQRDHFRSEDQRDDDQKADAAEEDGKYPVGEELCRISSALMADARVSRHEGRVERALREDRAEMIGKSQRNEEGVRNRSGSEHGRQHDVADKAGGARHQRQAADGEDASNHRPGPVFVLRRCHENRGPIIVVRPCNAARTRNSA